MLSEQLWGTHYKLKAYPFDMRDQFRFISDLVTRGKQAIADAAGRAGGRRVCRRWWASPNPGPAHAPIRAPRLGLRSRLRRDRACRPSL